MAFGYDETNVGNEQITKPGEYEVYATSFADKLTQQTRNEMEVLNYRVRTDVDQPAKGALIQYDNFVATPKAQWRFNALTKATEMYENGHDFGTPSNWAEEMLGKPFIAVVTMEEDNKGVLRPNVKSFKPSLHKPMAEKPIIKSQKAIDAAANSVPANMGNGAPAAGPTDPFTGNGGGVDISDADVPF
ncbi:DUF669 domain-containing protein [Levilactobacillus brevis]|uniref:DUF669 domain-containing protein n=1 Tax=Levilactobacillus brevis TaxID=1580 RepID=UPI00350F7D10